MSVYPSGIDSFTPVVSGVSEIRSVDISDLQSALTATQNTIGTSGSYSFPRYGRIVGNLTLSGTEYPLATGNGVSTVFNCRALLFFQLFHILITEMVTIVYTLIMLRFRCKNFNIYINFPQIKTGFMLVEPAWLQKALMRLVDSLLETI